MKYVMIPWLYVQIKIQYWDDLYFCSFRIQENPTCGIFVFRGVGADLQRTLMKLLYVSGIYLGIYYSPEIFKWKPPFHSRSLNGHFWPNFLLLLEEYCTCSHSLSRFSVSATEIYKDCSQISMDNILSEHFQWQSFYISSWHLISLFICSSYKEL